MNRPRFSGDQIAATQPARDEGGLTPGSFMVCPAAVQAAMGGGFGPALEVYRLAYEQARAALGPSLLERHLRPARD